MAFMTLKDIDVCYDKKKQVLKGLNLEVEEGELVSLLGPSGCGKTTTLRVVAGFIEPQGGIFSLDGTDLTKVPVHKRNFGIVFQSYALFPHLSVYDNVAFGLKIRKLDKAEMDKKVKNILEVCGLTEFANRFPQQMSGGQRQRVALARALVIEPKLLLLDEPLSNLDAKLRINMRMEIKRIQKQLGITTLFVTHDQEECFSISDKVAVMNRGVIEQYDTPEHIYSRPETEFVARFIGFENFLTLHKGGDIYRTDGGEAFSVKTAHGTVPSEETVTGTIRPEDILVDTEDRTVNVLAGTVGVRTFLGKSYQYEVNTAAGKFLVNRTADESYEEGQMVRLYLPEEKLILVNGNNSDGSSS
ncbi:putative spermidine/putrescine transport system ATP-binding protein [Hungatella effluvii]|uniref:Putative spermidine/putrescine transport system ATP-binding protein n=1 Tax=Hungatella effluvii TaxID=1096246 RepID=A0A2V3YGZ6_9FIRM|nr:ABC transporter ATP-binding protein [Hungatella effluvii]PXX56910.1 putative spermidine/putrescine transport system ATP-binding protein [Hungatella effluvii]